MYLCVANKSTVVAKKNPCNIKQECNALLRYVIKISFGAIKEHDRETLLAQTNIEIKIPGKAP